MDRKKISFVDEFLRAEIRTLKEERSDLIKIEELSRQLHGNAFFGFDKNGNLTHSLIDNLDQDMLFDLSKAIYRIAKSYHENPDK